MDATRSERQTGESQYSSRNRLVLPPEGVWTLHAVSGKRGRANTHRGTGFAGPLVLPPEGVWTLHAVSGKRVGAIHTGKDCASSCSHRSD